MPFTCAALDVECNLLALSHSGLEEALTLVNSFSSAIAALDAPSSLVRAGTRKRPDKQTPAAPGLRSAERALRARGIQLPRTVIRPDSARGEVGRALYEHLRKEGFIHHPENGASHHWLEANPHACFTALLGKNPLPRQTLEGRLQRQIILYDADVNLKDPMDFFEEVTRHRLRMGQLPTETLYTPDQLDALMLAYTAWMAARRPAETNSVGTEEEGLLVLPVGELKEKY